MRKKSSNTREKKKTLKQILGTKLWNELGKANQDLMKATFGKFDLGLQKTPPSQKKPVQQECFCKCHSNPYWDIPICEHCQPPQGKWEERFEAEHKRTQGYYKYWLVPFIKSLLKEDRDRMRKEVQKMKDIHFIKHTQAHENGISLANIAPDLTCSYCVAMNEVLSIISKE